MSGGAAPSHDPDPDLPLTDEQKVDTFVNHLENGHKYTKDELYSNLKDANEFFLQNSKDSKFVVEQLNTRKEFNRVAAVYNKNMYSAFILPVWAAAYSTEENQGFVLYPRLHSVKSLLDDDESFKRLEEKKVKQEEVMLEGDKPEEIRLEGDKLEVVEEAGQDITLKEARQAIRRKILHYTFAPVALAIDTLHTPVTNRRPMFYHRDISVNTVFLKTGEHHPVSRGNYRNAKLKLTELSAECFESYDMENSLGCGLGYDYFHHPEPFGKSNSHLMSKKYLKRHDWFSFGVLIVEVLTRLAGHEFSKHQPSEEEPDRAGFYEKAAESLTSITPAELIERFGIDYTEDYKLYVDIAKECLTSQSEAFNLTLDHDPYQFEYGVGLQTAKLLKLHYESRLTVRYEEDDPQTPTVPKCQACLLYEPAPIPTRSYRTENHPIRCSADCDRFYCTQCHTNGERLFCPRHEHGPTRTSIGGDAYFALILYGNQYEDENNKYVFRRDAENMRNVLMHSMICGIPVENIVLSALFDEFGDYIPKEMLGRACGDLKSEIAKINDKFDYHLFVYYSGHGSKDHAWYPTDSDELSVTYIDEKLSPLLTRGAINAGSCRQVIYILDHCYPSSTNLGMASGDNEHINTLTLRAPSESEADLQDDGKSSVFTDRLCDFLRSLIQQECDLRCSKCPHKLDDVIKHIVKEYRGSYLHPESFDRFMACCLSSAFVDYRDTDEQKIIMAPYHEGGVRMKVFAFEKSKGFEKQSGSGPFEIDFSEILDFKNLSRYIMGKIPKKPKADRDSSLGKVGKDGYPRICFLTNGVGTACSTEYDIVWESDVRHILALGSLNLERNPLSPSVLYYRVVDTPLKVKLKFGEIEDPSTYKLNWKSEEETLSLETARVPSLLVCMVHHLFLMYQNTARRLERQDAGEDAANDDDDEEVTDESEARYKSDYRLIDEWEDTKVSLTETSVKVRNSFAGFLCNPPHRDGIKLDTLMPNDWKKLAVEAGKYKQSRAIFEITQIDPKGPICIEWKDTEDRVTTDDLSGYGLTELSET